MTPDEPSFPGPPDPHIPPETLPSPTPDRPEVQPAGPAVWTPRDELRSRVHDELFNRRTVLLDRVLDDETASLVAAQLMSLDADADAEPDADGALPAVTLVVNSPGGPVQAAPAVLDTMDLMRCPVDTQCIGQAAGTAAVVVAAGTGWRRAGAGALFRLRLPDVELGGTAGRLEDEVAHHRRTVDALVDRLTAATGQDRSFVARDVERGRALPADEAVSFGLVDELIRKET